MSPEFTRTYDKTCQTCAGICEALDQDGTAVQYQRAQSHETRRYDDRYWRWDRGETRLVKELQPFDVIIRLSTSPTQPPPVSISELKGYIYVVYADRVFKVDIPFDPDGGWIETEADPNLVFRVDPTTPPCPGPLQRVNIAPVGSGFGLFRPVAPVPLYKYETLVRSKTGCPMMGLFDPVPWYPRSLFPLGDYVIVRTELFDSSSGKADHFFTQMIVSNPSGDTGARCSGQKEQIVRDTYDSVRHVVAVHPVEVKIPFVLRNMPIPGNSGGASEASP